MSFFPAKKSYTKKELKKRKKVVAINTVMTKWFQSPVPHVNKDDDDDGGGGKLSCWRGGGAAATGKGAFTLGVKDSSIKSPNTKLVI